MALLVTILLMMINFASVTSKESPATNKFCAMDMWMLSTYVHDFATWIEW